MKGLRFLALSALFATTIAPIVMSMSFMWPFIEPKALWFRGFVGAAFAVWVVMGFGGRCSPRLTSISALFAAVIGLLFIADLRAPLWQIAFFGRSERMEGFFGFCYLFLFLIAASALLDTEKVRRRFVGFHMAISLIVGAIGCWQVWMFWLQGRPEMQIFSTLGNPVYLGQYGVLMCLLALWWTVGAARRSLWFGVLTIAMANAMVFLSQGRGATLALLLAMGVLVLTLARGRAWALGTLAAAIGLLVLLPALDHSLPRVHRFIDIGADDPRFAIWEHALEYFRQRPWIGWGNDGMEVAGGWQYRTDRAHNLFLDWLVQGGVAGLALWLWLLGATVRRVWLTQQGAARAALLAFLTAYLVSNMTMFDTLTSYMLLITAMALVSVPLPEAVARRAWRPRVRIMEYAR